MKNIYIILITIFSSLLFSFQSYAQDDMLIKRDKVFEAYKNKEHALAITIIEDIKPQFKSWPLNLLGIEIISKHELFKNEPYKEYKVIEEMRELVPQYLTNSSSNKDQHLEEVIEIKYRLESYPKDQTGFLAKVEEMKQRAIVTQLELEKRKEEERILEEQEEVEREARLQASRVQAEKDRIAAEYAKKEREQLENQREERDAIKAKERNERRVVYQKEQDRETRKENKKYLFKTQKFSNLGVISGEIGKYGLLYERGGGSNTIGFRVSVRSSLIPEEDILNGSIVENRNEVDFGPNFKLAKFLYLNVGGGYGVYQYKLEESYQNQDKVEYEGYFTANAGLMIRLGRVVSISGGASFKDVDQDSYEPEYTVGLSFNLKGKDKF